MVDHDLGSDRSDWVVIDAAWFRREFIEGVRQFFAPFVGAAAGFWGGLTRTWRDQDSRRT